MKTKTLTRISAIGAVGALALFGAACEAEDTGGTSPGQEAPADPGLGDDTGGDLGTDTGSDF